MTKEERKARLRKRTRRGVDERGQTGLGRKSVLDLSKANGTVHKFAIDADRGKSKMIDILPFVVTQTWYKNLRTKSGSLSGLDVGDWDYKLEVPVHSGVGDGNDVFVCLQMAFGQKCPLCEELYAEWDKEKADQDERKISALMISWRDFYNVYDYDGESGGIELGYNIAYKNFEEVLQDAVDCDDEGLVTFWDLEDGRTIEYKTREKKFGKNPYHEGHSIKFVKRDSYNEDILGKTYPLDAMLIIPTYEDVARAHLGLDEDEVQQAASEGVEEEPPARTRPRQIGRSKSAQAEVKEGDGTGKRDIDGSFPECPAGGRFGTDCNKLKACESCDEALFELCGKAFADGQGEQKVELERVAEKVDDKPKLRRRRSI